jgi:hypothetical protein
VAMGHGWPALPCRSDPAHALAQGVETPCTPTAVPSPTEARS